MIGKLKKKSQFWLNYQYDGKSEFYNNFAYNKIV